MGIHHENMLQVFIRAYYEYSKCSKISNILFHIILALIMFFMQLFLKILNGMANSVDPDQTAPSGAV